MCGPTGVGWLWARAELLEAMRPTHGGGDMVSVSLDGHVLAPPPLRFETGTPNVAGVIGLGAAVDFLSALGMRRVAEHEKALGELLHARLAAIPGVKIYGPPPSAAAPRAALVAFSVAGLSAAEVRRGSETCTSG